MVCVIFSLCSLLFAFFYFGSCWNSNLQQRWLNIKIRLWLCLTQALIIILIKRVIITLHFIIVGVLIWPWLLLHIQTVCIVFVNVVLSFLNEIIVWFVVDKRSLMILLHTRHISRIRIYPLMISWIRHRWQLIMTPHILMMLLLRLHSSEIEIIICFLNLVILTWAEALVQIHLAIVSCHGLVVHVGVQFACAVRCSGQIG